VPDAGAAELPAQLQAAQDDRKTFGRALGDDAGGVAVPDKELNPRFPILSFFTCRKRGSLMAVPAKLDPKALKPELADFREKTDAFSAGQMPKPDYKGFSVYFGSYALRRGDASMLRLRMPAGRVTEQRVA